MKLDHELYAIRHIPSDIILMIDLTEDIVWNKFYCKDFDKIYMRHEVELIKYNPVIFHWTKFEYSNRIFVSRVHLREFVVIEGKTKKVLFRFDNVLKMWLSVAPREMMDEFTIIYAKGT